MNFIKKFIALATVAVAVNAHAAVPANEAPDALVKRISQEVIEIVLRALAAYQLQGDDAIHMVRVLRSVLHGFATLESGGGFGMPLAVDETFRRLMETLLLGLHHANEAGK